MRDVSNFGYIGYGRWSSLLRRVRRQPIVGFGIACLTLSMTAAAVHADVTWDAGGTDNNWTTPDNWSANALPDTTANVRIGAAATMADPVIINSDVGSVVDMWTTAATPGAFVNVEPGAALTTTSGSENDSFNVGRGSGNVGTLMQTGGAVTAGNAIRIGASGGTGLYSISDGTLTGVKLFLGHGGGDTFGTLLQAGGTVTITSGDANDIRVGEGGADRGTFGISAGTFNSSAGFNLGTSGAGISSATFSGSAKATITNRFNVNSANDYVILSGSKTGDGTDVSVNSFNLAASNDGGTLEALIDPAAITDPAALRKIVANNVSFGTGAQLELAFGTGPAVLPPSPGTWTILTWASGNPNAANLSLAPDVAPGWSFNVDTVNHALTVTYAAVPEPASLGLLAIGGLAFLKRKRPVRD